MASSRFPSSRWATPSACASPVGPRPLSIRAAVAAISKRSVPARYPSVPREAITGAQENPPGQPPLGEPASAGGAHQSSILRGLVRSTGRSPPRWPQQAGERRPLRRPTGTRCCRIARSPPRSPRSGRMGRRSVRVQLPGGEGCYHGARHVTFRFGVRRHGFAARVGGLPYEPCPSSLLPSRRPRLVRERLGEPTPPQREGWPHIRGGPQHADRRAHRHGQDAGRVPLGDRRPAPRRARRWPTRRRSSTSRRCGRSATTCRRTSQGPLAELRELRPALPEIRVLVRTGDTPPARARGDDAASRRTSWSPRRSRSTSCSPATAGARCCAPCDRDRRRDPRPGRATSAASHLALSLERLEALAGGRSSASASRRRRSRSSDVGALPGRRRARVRAGRRRPPRELDLAVEVPPSPLDDGVLARAVGRDLRAHRRADRASTAPRWSSSTRASWPSASRRGSPSVLGRGRRSPATTAACRASAGSTPSSGSRRASCGRWSPPRRSSWASTSATSTW